MLLPFLEVVEENGNNRIGGLGRTDHSFTAAFLSKTARFCVGNARKVSNLAALSALDRTFLSQKSATRPNGQFALAEQAANILYKSAIEPAFQGQGGGGAG
ncbi:hypothetical protein L1281_001443 [Neisseria sp. HSC-16F19]|nr:hypothetical protein [Neisseria sp. HSC-16F19]MCP2040853.1 hypothetical protein [Neisseria sp. HSC-16F19]